MESWWQLGEGMGTQGTALATYNIECAFCGEKGNFKVASHFEKKQPNNRTKKLNFDTLECGSCSGYVMVFLVSGKQPSFISRRSVALKVF